MFVIFVYFIVVGFVVFTIGKSTTLFINKRYENYTFYDSFFIGLALISSIISIWSLFLPTNIYCFLFLFILSLFLFYYFKIFLIVKKYFNVLLTNKILIILLVIILSIVVLLSVVTPQQYDAYLYHINAIQWNENYKCVQGLANLHDRLGFNSSVFILNSCFSFYSIYNQYLFLINSLSFFVFIFFVVHLIYRKKGIIGFYLLIYIFFFFNQYHSEISSPGTDVLPNILIAYLFIKLLFLSIKDFSSYSLVFIFLPFFCITLKLSTLPIVLLILVPIIHSNESFIKKLGKITIYGAILVLPWIVRNVMLTGYLIYPTSSLDFFDFDWKVPVELVIETKKWVYSWARIPSLDCNLVLQMPFHEWVDIWWKALKNTNKMLIILAILSPIITSIYFINNRKKTKLFQNYLIFNFVGFLILVFWFLTAPDVRFVYSVIVLLALSILLLINTNKNKIINIVLALSSFFVIYCFTSDSYTLFQKDYSLKNADEYVYLPEDVYLKKILQKVNFNKKILNTIDNKKIIIYESLEKVQCFDQFPSTTLLNTNLKLRGENIEDRFKIQWLLII